MTSLQFLFLFIILCFSLPGYLVSGESCGIRRYDTNVLQLTRLARSTNATRSVGNATKILPTISLNPKGSVRVQVVGGRPVDAYSWPWMVAILKKKGTTTEKKLLCGGTIISKKHVLTAAHCFEERNIDPSSYVVRVGAHDLNGSGTDYPVKAIRKHEQYKSDKYYNDIAIITLGREVPDAVAACLPEQDVVDLQGSAIDNRPVYVLGWGHTSFGGRPSNILQEAPLNVVSNEKCNTNYSTLGISSLHKGIQPHQLCAASLKGDRDACQSDSGGPLLTLADKAQRSRYFVVGVVSFGNQCGSPGFPGVYTRVSHFVPWIKTHTA